MARYNMDVTGIIANSTARLKVGINRGLNRFKDTAKVISPSDTGVFVASHEIIPAQEDGSLIIGSVKNEVPYAGYLENSKKTKNYYKGKRTYKNRGRQKIYTGKGNMTYGRTAEIEKENIKNFILEALR